MSVMDNVSAIDEVRGVRLRDVFRDNYGELWEVVGICTEPTAIVRKVSTKEQEQHVIGCRSWDRKWQAGPLRANPAPVFGEHEETKPK